MCSLQVRARASAAVCYRRHKEYACVPKQPLELLVEGYMTFDLGTLHLRRGTYARVLYPHHPSPNLLQ